VTDDAVSTSMPAEPGEGPVRLRLRFLLPLALVLLVISGLFIVQMYLHERHMVSAKMQRLQQALPELYHYNIEAHVHMLGAVMETIGQNHSVDDALDSKDRNLLLTLSAPVFTQLRKEFDITDLSFIAPDGKNILRAQQPARHGDTIRRATLRQAERTQRRAYGVELGSTGALDLRLVRPWFHRSNQQKTLIGYTELGMDIGHSLRDIHRSLGGNLYLLIFKKYLDRKSWEQGMRMSGRAPRWDRFGSVVQKLEIGVPLPAYAEHIVSETAETTRLPDKPVTIYGKNYRGVAEPVIDAAGRHIGAIVVTYNTYKLQNALHHAMVMGGGFAFGSGLFLVVVFSILIGRIERQINDSRIRLHRLATHDGLTGLFNHRMLHHNLELELKRGHRYPHPISVLMIDIDHFKRINDVYGHLCGDKVLKEIAHRILRAARITDTAYRFGGEEFTILLPQTGADEAKVVGKRVHAIIADTPFTIQDNIQTPVTVSVGIATATTGEATTADDLIACADEALYRAKSNGRNQVVAYSPTIAATDSVSNHDTRG
jgi:diguanylate cyclase (GGDEF)-like protein